MDKKYKVTDNLLASNIRTCRMKEYIELFIMIKSIIIHILNTYDKTQH